MTDLPIFRQDLLYKAFNGDVTLVSAFQQLIRYVTEAAVQASSGATVAEVLSTASLLTLSPVSGWSGARVLAEGDGISLADDGSRITVSLNGASPIIDGGFPVTFLVTGDTNLILPLIGTVATLADIAAAISTGTVTSFNTRTGAVTLTSADVTGALTYTPTSVTTLTGVQSVAAFKTGLALVKADVGLSNVDNTADAAKNVLTATKLVTPRNFTITGDGSWTISFDGSADVTAAITLATVNATVGSFGGAGKTITATVNAKGLVTAFAETAIAITASQVTDFSTAVGLLNSATATKLANARTLGITGDLVWTSPSFDGSANVTAAGTLATVNSNVGAFGSATQIPTFTVNAKGLTTAAANVAIAIPSTQVTDFTEAAQDAIGAMIDTSLVYVDATPLLTRAALTGDATAAQGSNALTLATVNSNVGSFGSATQVATFTVNAKGLTTAAANVTITPAVGSITGLGANVATALGVAVGTAGAFVVLNGAGGTPSSLTLTNATGLPVAGITASTVTALGVGSIELGHATDTTITRVSAGVVAIEGSNIIVSGGAGGTPSSLTLTNATGLPIAGLVASTSTAIGVGTIELGHATDTTIARVSAGKISVEGVNVVTISSADTLTNKTLTSPALTTPSLDVATGTSLALNGAALGTNKLAVNGSFLVVSGAGFTIRNGASDGFTQSQLTTNAWGITALSAGSWLTYQNCNLICANGRFGVGTAASTDPTAQIDMGVANSTTVPAIRFKTASAALMTTPSTGAFETDGTDLYFTNNAGTRKKVTIV